jgi:hypothetical protein
MKIGGTKQTEGGPADSTKPAGCVPAIWTYGHRMVRIEENRSDEFARDLPLYHPWLQEWGKGLAFYWSEIDFLEFGKNGDFTRAMFNTFLNKQHDSQTFDVKGAADGAYHTWTTEWRTHLRPLPRVTDAKVAEAEGFWWIRDPAVPYEEYWGHPLKKLGPDRYAVCEGKSARHWVDGRYIGENTRLVPAFSAQLNLGVWLPDWAGEARWKTASISYGPVKVWQYGDEGDVTGILRDDIGDNFDINGKPSGPR